MLRVCGVVPGVYEGVRGDGGAVGEFPALLQGDGVFRGVVVRGDGLGDFVFDLAALTEARQAGIELVDDLAASGFGGGAAGQSVGGLHAIYADGLGVGRVGTSGSAARQDECRRADGGACRDDPAHVLEHVGPFLRHMPLWGHGKKAKSSLLLVFVNIAAECIVCVTVSAMWNGRLQSTSAVMRGAGPSF